MEKKSTKNFITEDRRKIIEDFLPHIVTTARRFSKRLLDQSILSLEDLVQIGVLGLISALDRFDSEKASLKTYAEYRIKGAMLDALRAQKNISRKNMEKIFEIKDAYNKLENQNGQMPDEYEVAEYLNMSMDEYVDITSSAEASYILSLDKPNGSDDDHDPIIDFVSDENAESIETQIENRDLKDKLAQKIMELSEREQLILSLYYEKELTMKEISLILDISEGRVCQIHNQALIKLRAKLKI